MQHLALVTFLYTAFGTSLVQQAGSNGEWRWGMEEWKCANGGDWCPCTGRVRNYCGWMNYELYDRKNVVGGYTCHPDLICNTDCYCKPDIDLIEDLLDYNLASPWNKGKAANCRNLGCQTLSGGLSSCRARCENNADCNVFNFCSEEATCPTPNRCCIRQCEESGNVAGYDLQLTRTWYGWNTYAKRKEISGFKLEVPHTMNSASNCPNLGCKHTSNVEQCAAYCNENVACDVMNYCAEGSDCTSGTGRCCIRHCNGVSDADDLKLTSRWKGWDIWVKESRRN